MSAPSSTSVQIPVVDLIVEIVPDVDAVLVVVGGREAEVESDQVVTVHCLQRQSRSGPHSQSVAAPSRHRIIACVTNYSDNGSDIDMVVVYDEHPDHGVVDGDGDHDQRGIRAVHVVDVGQINILGHDNVTSLAMCFKHQKSLLILWFCVNPEYILVILEILP